MRLQELSLIPDQMKKSRCNKKGISTKIILPVVIVFIILLFNKVKAQVNPVLVWDSIKNSTMPTVETQFQSEFGIPYKQPLADYGWEDGLQISLDGLNLYALYSPMDLLSWQNYFTTHLNLPICNLVGNMSYIRPYAQTYGMDMVTNPFGCDSFANIDILYAHRNSLSDSFTSWQLSGIARPGAIEGGPATLFSETDPNHLDLFMFTGNSDIWKIKNTFRNPSGIDSAIRLPSPINAFTNEFNADNAFMERIHGDSIILIYEKYTDPTSRVFMTAQSSDIGATWSTPQAITTITNSLGHIEHPCLYKDNSNQWWLYFSINYTYIARAKQMMAGNWDSWGTPEMIIFKGNALSIGEPTVTRNGDISFSVAYKNTVINDSTDVYELDPWFLPSNSSTTGIANIEKQIAVAVYPNPFSSETILKMNTRLKNATLTIYNTFGQQVTQLKNLSGQTVIVHRDNLPSGLYFLQLEQENKILATEKLEITNN